MLFHASGNIATLCEDNSVIIIVIIFAYLFLKHFN